MSWQDFGTWVIVAAAALYLLRRAAAYLSRRTQSSCGGCVDCGQPSQQLVQLKVDAALDAPPLNRVADRSQEALAAPQQIAHE